MVLKWILHSHLRWRGRVTCSYANRARKMQAPSSAQCSQDVYSLRRSRSQQCRTHIAMPILQSPGGLWSFEACNCSSKFQIKLIKLMKFVPNFSKGNTPPALKVLTGPGGCIWSGDRRPCGALRRFRCCSRTVASWSRCWTSSVTWMQVKRLTETDSFNSVKDFLEI